MIKTCSVFTLLLSIGLLSAFVLQVGNFQEHLHRHNVEHARARAYLKNAHCRSSARRAELGDFHRCDDAERVLSAHPLFLSLVDTARGVSVVPWVKDLLTSLREDLHKILLALGILLIVWAWLLRGRPPARTMDRYSLPTICLED